MECLNCGENVEQLPKKRAKQFCDSTCRSNYWQKQNRKNKLQLPKDYAKTDKIAFISKVSKEKHKLWEEGDPEEGTNAFFIRKGAYTYDELLNS